MIIPKEYGSNIEIYERQQEDFTHLNKIAQVFELQIVVENYVEMEAQCFEAALDACKKKKWFLIESCSEELSKITDVAGRTLFMRAVSDWDDEFVKGLLKYKSLVFQTDIEGNTALHIAAQKGNVHQLPLLLNCLGFDAVNKAGETPVHTAIFHGQEQVLNTLITNGANDNVPLVWKSLNVSPLCLAVLLGETGCVDLLLNNRNFRQSIKGIGNLLHIAIHFNQTHMIEHLLDKHRVLMQDLLNEFNENDLCPIALAATLGNGEAIWTLNEKGANLEIEDSGKRTPLHHASLSCQPQVIRLLSSLKVNPHAVDRQGKTALALAESKKDESTDALETYNLLYNLLNHWGSAAYLKNSSYRDPENLAFKGGGAKGPHFVGVAEYLEKRDKLKNVKRVVGTSTGAIFATFVALGYSAKEMKEILLKKNLMDFIDDPICKVTIEELTATNKEAATCLSCYQSFKKAKTAGNQIIDFLKKWNKTTGICKGDSFLLWMEEEIIAKKVEKITGKSLEDCKYYTLGEHRKLIEAGKPLKHIHICGTKLGPPLEIVEFNSEDPKCDNYILSDLIRISMSIPIVYEAHCIHIKQGKDRVPYKEGGFFVDGGVLNNYPVSTFDEMRYQTKKDLGPEGRRPRFNNKTIGFNFTSFEPIQVQKEPKTIGDILISLATAYLQAESIIKNLNPCNKERTIDIDVKEVTTLSFNMDEQQKEESIQRGFEATERFFSMHDTPKSDSLFSIPMSEKIVKNRIDLPSILPNFTGRKGELTALGKIIPNRWNASISVKVICGPGGIGKSELAFAFANKNEEQFSLIWTIRCADHTLYEKSYRELARALNIPCEKEPINTVINKVNKTLCEGIDQKKPWLLIYDNMEGKIKRESIPQRGGCILMTSQHKDIWEDRNALIELSPLTNQECQDYFKLTIHKDPSQAMNNLIQALGGYPILLNLAAKSIYPYQSVEQYLELVKEMGAPVDEIDEHSSYQKTLASVFKVRFQQIQQSNPLAFEFLQLCAFLNPDYIPVPFLEFWLKDKNSKGVDVLRTLCDSCVCRYDSEKKILSLHRLQQEILRTIAKKEKYFVVINRLVQWGYEYKEEDLNTFKFNEGCFLQFEDLKAYPLWKEVTGKDKAPFLSICGNWLTGFKGDYKKALKFYAEALEIQKKDLGEQHRHTAIGYNNVGMCHVHLGNYNEALNYFEIAFKIITLQEPDMNIGIYTAVYCDNIGGCLEKLNRFEEAMEHRKWALDLRKKYCGEKSLETALSHNNFGSSLMKCGRLMEALDSCKTALTIQKELVGKDHRSVALTYYLIGAIAYHSKIPEKALEYFKKSLAIKKKFLSEEHSEIHITYREIIKILNELKRYEEALKNLQELLEIQKKTLDEDNLNLAKTYHNMGVMLKKLGRSNEALEPLNKAAGIYEKVRGENDPETQLILKNISDTEFQLSGSSSKWLLGLGLVAVGIGSIFLWKKKSS